MDQKSIFRGCSGFLMAAAVFVACGGADAPGQAYQGISKPSKDLTLSFVRPGLVTKVMVKEGDSVGAGATIAQLDDSEEQVNRDADFASATNDAVTEIDVEREVLKQDTMSAARIQKAGGSVSELADAEQKVTVDGARVKLAEGKKLLADYKVKVDDAVLRKTKLLSPVDGIVAQSFLKEGEAAEGGNMKVVRLVQIDPMWVEVPVPVTKARSLKKGDMAVITLSDNMKMPEPGKVALIFPVGDSASETVMVRVEVPNPGKISPGENVHVSFSGASAAGVAAP